MKTRLFMKGSVYYVENYSWNYWNSIISTDRLGIGDNDRCDLNWRLRIDRVINVVGDLIGNTGGDCRYKTL